MEEATISRRLEVWPDGIRVVERVPHGQSYAGRSERMTLDFRGEFTHYWRYPRDGEIAEIVDELDRAAEAQRVAIVADLKVIERELA